MKFSFKLAIYIETLHCSVRFIISDTTLKFSAIIHYHRLFMIIEKIKNIMQPNRCLNTHIETGSVQ